MPVEIGFCDQCRELTCDDPDVCAEARVCQVAADGLRDLADVVEHSPELAAELEFAIFAVSTIGHSGRTEKQSRTAYEACVAGLGSISYDVSSGTHAGRARIFGPLRLEVYGPADIIEGERVVTTFTTHYDQRFAHIPQRVLVDEMDRARRLVEDTQRIHDTLAYELGFDRVRIEDIEPGDRIPSNEGDTFYEVHHIDTWVEKGGFDSHLRVWFAGRNTVERYEPGQMVSRKRDESTEPF